MTLALSKPNINLNMILACEELIREQERMNNND